MDGDGEDFNLHWEEEEVETKHIPGVVASEVICGLDNVQAGSYSNMSSEVIIQDTDQIAAENLMFLSQDVVSYADAAEFAVDPSVECVTEEVIADDWTEGQDRVEVPLEHFSNPVLYIKQENDVDVPLPTDQDQYTAMRPWPCDFCSRRFRKKAALMNHMVAHQNDRPHVCNLCGVRYVRKCDLMNHLKVHAMVPDNADPIDYEDVLDNSQVVKPKKKRGRRKKIPEPVEENGELWENMTSARTMQWSRRARSPARPRSPTPSPSPSPTPPPPASPPSEPEPCPPPSDPSRPFVCRHCGVGFAREKALQSHSRIHGGDSPIECGSCGELCWSREALATHTRQRHPHQPPQPRQREPYDSNSGDDDMEYQLSPLADSGSERAVYDTQRGPELFCQDCGVAFQRADLLRRHQAAAHRRGSGTGEGITEEGMEIMKGKWSLPKDVMTTLCQSLQERLGEQAVKSRTELGFCPGYTRHKRHDSSSSTWAEHSCDVCGEACADALQLLAHAERHADRPAPTRFKKSSRGRNNASSNSSRQFPCRECGKVFGSRSSQQIHIRIHTGERPYACRFCWKAFADGGTLRKHERIHTGEKPYACAVCPRAFNQRVVLREHVRSHHSAPDRRANGGPSFCCVVCGRTLHSSAELVQHLIQHCDANTALKRQPQTGPRKYKRRRKIKSEQLSPRHSWERGSASPAPPSPPALLALREPPAPAARAPAPAPAPRRRPRAAPRPRMIHTEERKTRAKQTTRGRRPPRRPADDLRAIRPRPAVPSPLPSPEPSPAASPAPPTPSPPPDPSPPTSPLPTGPFKCEMCAEEFPRRDALLLHVPVHI